MQCKEQCNSSASTVKKKIKNKKFDDRCYITLVFHIRGNNSNVTLTNRTTTVFSQSNIQSVGQGMAAYPGIRMPLLHTALRETQW